MLVGVIVTPAGAPVIVAVGVPLKPPVAVTVAVTVVEPPCATLALVGLSEIVIPGVGVVVSLSPLDPHACTDKAIAENRNTTRGDRLRCRIIRCSFASDEKSTAASPSGYVIRAS
jgi:hypothetical protein